jgi:hypothetical protein
VAAFQRSVTLVGDIGDIIAGLEYDLDLDDVSRPDHDAQTRDGRLVQIKTTFKEALTFKKCPDYYLGFKLYFDGRCEEVFNVKIPYFGLTPAHLSAIPPPRGRPGEDPMDSPYRVEYLDAERLLPLLVQRAA